MSRADGTWSAGRSPRPAMMRSASACGLGLKTSSYHGESLSKAAPLVSSLQAGRQPRHVCRGAKDASAAASAAQTNGSSAPQHIGTAAVHGGERGGRPSIRDALTTPIVQTSTYFFENTAQLIEYNEGRFQSYEYGRYGNPTVQTCEEKIKALEGAEDCIISASGMNSVTSMLLSLVPASGHIVTTSDCYWRTR